MLYTLIPLTPCVTHSNEILQRNSSLKALDHLTPPSGPAMSLHAYGPYSVAMAFPLIVAIEDREGSGGGGQFGHGPHPVCQWDLPPPVGKALAAKKNQICCYQACMFSEIKTLAARLCRDPAGGA